MKIREEFFKNEVRGDFFVASMMKRAWAAQMEVLSIFDNFCKENNLKYYLAFGTLLGAVRHKGFIPWDDDLDVWMVRNDYERLRRLAKENKLPEGLKYNSTYNNGEYTEPFDRIINNSGMIFDIETVEKYHGCPFAVGVDVFPLDYLPEGKEFEEFKEDTLNIVYILAYLKKDKGEKLNPRMIQLLEMRYGFKIDPQKNVDNQICQIIDMTAQKCNKGKKLIETFFWAFKGTVREYDANWFGEPEYIQFEDMKLPVPSNYKRVLECIYSDYMTPIRSSVGIHDYPYFVKQDELLYEKTNYRFLSEKYNVNEVSQYHNTSKEKKNIKSILSQKIDLLIRINECLIDMISSGDINSINDFLEDSQELAIKIGGILEDKYDKDIIKEIIINLENYCENLYSMSTSVFDNSDNFVDSFQSNMILAVEIKKQITLISQKPRKTILFVFETQIDWNHYAHLYDLLNQKEDLVCYAMQIPYYIKNSRLNIEEDNLLMDEDIEKGDVEFVDYKEFDFEGIDCIIKSNPYDNDSYGDVIAHFFYSQNLNKYCNVLIHIPTLDIADFDEEDMHLMQMSNYFVKTPGVLYSDYVLLKSEKNTKTYTKILNTVSEKVAWDNKVFFCSDDDVMVEKIRGICEKNGIL